MTSTNIGELKNEMKRIRALLEDTIIHRDQLRLDYWSLVERVASYLEVPEYPALLGQVTITPQNHTTYLDRSFVATVAGVSEIVTSLPDVYVMVSKAFDVQGDEIDERMWIDAMRALISDPRFPPSDRLRMARDLYYTSDRYDAMLSTYFDIPADSLSQSIGAGKMIAFCTGCGLEHQIEVGRRLSFDAVLFARCPDCKARDAGAEALKRTPLADMSYDEYLLTEHWRITREAALERAGWRCSLCNSPWNLQVHHRNYDRLGEELPTDLLVLCAGCHRRHHGK